MVDRGVRKVKGRNRGRKRAGRRPRGVQVLERHGAWHAYGTVRAGGRAIRVRQSLNLAVERHSQDQAEEAARDLEAEIRARAEGKTSRGAAVAIAAEAYLKIQRERPLRPSSIRIIKQVVAKFGERRLNEIPDEDWFSWIDGDVDGRKPGIMAGNKSSTRERFLNTVAAFLNFCKVNHGLRAAPAFRRDRKATRRTRRTRRVEELRAELLRILLEESHITLRAQIAVEISTGARVSSVLHGARLCDLSLAPGRAMITFRGTKSGEDVPAVLDGNAVEILKGYLKWRGKLHDREAPLFLTPKRKPYADNGGTFGSQNKTSFNNAKARAVARIRNAGAAAARQARAAGDRAGAIEAAAKAKSDAALLAKVTQHWFRHRLATLWLRKDPRGAMEQGGWLDIQSVMGYAHDAPDYRRQVAGELDVLKGAS